jgi:hypothetical protein
MLGFGPEKEGPIRMQGETLDAMWDRLYSILFDEDLANVDSFPTPCKSC